MVSGAAGFIGRALCRELARRGYAVVGATRAAAEPIEGATLRALGDIGPGTDWRTHLRGIDIVVHLATRAHRPPNPAAAALEAEAAAALARAAAAVGVSRLVHISSIRAMGERTAPGTPFRAGDTPRPRDAYGRAKLAIERAVDSAASSTGLDHVILRPPLVYGPGVKGNLRALLALIAGGIPLPVAALDNRRSLIFVDNFAQLIATACTHPAARGRILLARDAADLSTPELVHALATGLGRRPRLFAVPPALLAAFCGAPVLGPAWSRLTLSLQLDDGETRRALGWRPTVTPEAGLAATARAYRRRPPGERPGAIGR